MRLSNAGMIMFLTASWMSSTQLQAQTRGERAQEEKRGGFTMPPPPIVSAIDTDGDGEISADELSNAVAGLKALDKDDNGELAGPELMPDFGRGRGGRRRVGPGGFRMGASPDAERVPPEKIEFKDGASSIPDHATFQKLSYRGAEVMIDTFLANLEFVKFTLDKAASEDEQALYFINTGTHRAHMMFARVAGLSFGRGAAQMKGVLVFRPMLESPGGNPGLYTFEFEPFDAYSFDMVKICQDALVEKMPALEGNIGYYPRGEGAQAKVNKEKDLFKSVGVHVYFEEDLTNTDLAYLPLNPGQSFGRLRLMEIGELPGQRDIVLYKTLPNEMPRVAGIITAVRQTPLSHVNLRAIQDKVPNAFITDAAENDSIQPLIGKYVSYKVTADGYEMREATLDEVESHFSALRPDKKQVPVRDLTIKRFRPLQDISFEDSPVFGIKASNLATLHSFGLPEGTVPDGYALPFYFYDEFMKHSAIYDDVRNMLADPEFRSDRETREAALVKFRKNIEKTEMPDWMMEALAELHASFPEGSSIRCRSSTNNEDLPGFSGAGLYDSFTHDSDEGHLSKTIKQVFASLWNFRAFEEREFYRVDHFSTAMAVLLHPNYEDELANGVAVTDDILYQTDGNYYVNTQVGEDMVTNPNLASIPEELLLDWWKSTDVRVMRSSNRVDDGRQLLSGEQLDQLREHLGVIHGKFAPLYGRSLEDENFAMEIEFKITKDGQLAIKQARPWVYAQTPNTAANKRESGE